NDRVVAGHPDGPPDRRSPRRKNPEVQRARNRAMGRDRAHAGENAHARVTLRFAICAISKHRQECHIAAERLQKVARVRALFASTPRTGVSKELCRVSGTGWSVTFSSAADAARIPGRSTFRGVFASLSPLAIF